MPDWDDRASRWKDWGPPLRPCEDDVQRYARFVRRHARFLNGKALPDVLLLGVTPELAEMELSFPYRLQALDSSPEMLRKVWPGDVPGRRSAMVGDWLNPPFPPESFDAVVADGAPVFFSYPDGVHELFASVARLLRPGGVFVFRAFVSMPEQEGLHTVMSDARAGLIPNFHVFKWRVAMAIQASAEIGVRQHDVWRAVKSSGLRFGSLPQPGFSRRAVGTIRFYEGKEDRLHFPCSESYAFSLSRIFTEVCSETPAYPLGERCPTFAAFV